MVSRLLENMSRCRSEWPAGHAVRRSAGLARLAHSLCGQVGTVGALAGTLHSTVSLVRKGSRRWRERAREGSYGHTSFKRGTP